MVFYILYTKHQKKKKALKKFGLRTWGMEKPFGYRVVHHNAVFIKNSITLLKAFTVKLVVI